MRNWRRGGNLGSEISSPLHQRGTVQDQGSFLRRPRNNHEGERIVS